MTHDWELLCRTANRMEAELIKSLLESAGIPFIDRGESLGSIYGLSFGKLAEVSLYVPREVLEDAQKLLASDNPEADSDSST